VRGPRARISELPGDCPVTWAVLGANVLTFIGSFIAETSWAGLAFFSPTFLQRPWTAVTYPLIGTGSIFWILIGGYVFWMFGGSLERSWGGRGYIAFPMLGSASSAGALWLGRGGTGRGGPVAGFLVALAAVTRARVAVQ